MMSRIFLVGLLFQVLTTTHGNPFPSNIYQPQKEMKHRHEVTEETKNYGIFLKYKEIFFPSDESLQTMKIPRCALPRSARIVKGKWNNYNLYWCLEKPWDKVPVCEQRKILAKAFEFWSEETVFRFSESSCQKADIVFRFSEGERTNNLTFDGKGSKQVFLTTTKMSRDEFNKTTIYFDPSENWLTTDTQEASLLFSAGHAIGHSLGLNHSDEPDSVMHFLFRYPVMRINRRDRRTLQRIYGDRVLKRKWRSEDPASQSEDSSEKDSFFQPIETVQFPEFPSTSYPPHAKRNSLHLTENTPKPTNISEANFWFNLVGKKSTELFLRHRTNPIDPAKNSTKTSKNMKMVIPRKYLHQQLRESPVNRLGFLLRSGKNPKRLTEDDLNESISPKNSTKISNLGSDHLPTDIQTGFYTTKIFFQRPEDGSINASFSKKRSKMYNFGSGDIQSDSQKSLQKTRKITQIYEDSSNKGTSLLTDSQKGLEARRISLKPKDGSIEAFYSKNTIKISNFSSDHLLTYSQRKLETTRRILPRSEGSSNKAIFLLTDSQRNSEKSKRIPPRSKDGSKKAIFSNNGSKTQDTNKTQSVNNSRQTHDPLNIIVEDGSNKAISSLTDSQKSLGTTRGIPSNPEDASNKAIFLLTDSSRSLEKSRRIPPRPEDGSNKAIFLLTDSQKSLEITRGIPSKPEDASNKAIFTKNDSNTLDKNKTHGVNKPRQTQNPLNIAMDHLFTVSKESFEKHRISSKSENGSKKAILSNNGSKTLDTNKTQGVNKPRLKQDLLNIIVEDGSNKVISLLTDSQKSLGTTRGIPPRSKDGSNKAISLLKVSQRSLEKPRRIPPRSEDGSNKAIFSNNGSKTLDTNKRQGVYKPRQTQDLLNIIVEDGSNKAISLLTDSPRSLETTRGIPSNPGDAFNKAIFLLTDSQRSLKTTRRILPRSEDSSNKAISLLTISQRSLEKSRSPSKPENGSNKAIFSKNDPNTLDTNKTHGVNKPRQNQDPLNIIVEAISVLTDSQRSLKTTRGIPLRSEDGSNKATSLLTDSQKGLETRGIPSKAENSSNKAIFSNNGSKTLDKNKRQGVNKPRPKQDLFNIIMDASNKTRKNPIPIKIKGNNSYVGPEVNTQRNVSNQCYPKIKDCNSIFCKVEELIYQTCCYFLKTISGLFK